METTKSIMPYSAGRDAPLLNMAGKVLAMTSVWIAGNQEYDLIPRTLDERELRAIALPSTSLLLSEAGEVEQLQPAKTSISTRRLTGTVKTAIVDSFVTLYNKGFSAVILFVFAGVVVISILQWL